MVMVAVMVFVLQQQAHCTCIGDNEEAEEGHYVDDDSDDDQNDPANNINQ